MPCLRRTKLVHVLIAGSSTCSLLQECNLYVLWVIWTTVGGKELLYTYWALIYIPVYWVWTDGLWGNKTIISLINVQTHGASLSSYVYWGFVIIVWLDKKREAISERPHSHCTFVPTLLVVICWALHLIAIRQTADAERLKREICCLFWA